MNRRQQVFVKLKLKAKALGFNSKELKGIAAKIADNLISADDASEEDVNAEIDEKLKRFFLTLLSASHKPTVCLMNGRKTTLKQMTMMMTMMIHRACKHARLVQKKSPKQRKER